MDTRGKYKLHETLVKRQGKLHMQPQVWPTEPCTEGFSHLQGQPC